MNNEVIDHLKQMISDNSISINENMSRHTTFKTGGPASLFISPNNQDELQKIMKYVEEQRADYFILGNGSNILVSDAGFDGVVISLRHFDEISLQEGSEVVVGAGVLNSAIASFVKENSLAGFEFAAGIPGTIGGAMIMNAGAYGGEMKQIVKDVTVLSPGGSIKTLSNEEMEFGYRTSFVKGKGYVVLSVTLQLEPGVADEISARITELALKRKEKQPLEYPSAGSTFKRPEGYFAGKLIEDAGLRGYTVGGACVSEKHCGFVINKENATSADIYKLIQDVKEKVKSTSGVELEPEVIMIGKF